MGSEPLYFVGGVQIPYYFNQARKIFKNAVAEMFGGEKNIPHSVKKAMEVVAKWPADCGFIAYRFFASL